MYPKCDICGKPVMDGMTNCDGDFHVHEGKCFYDFMDQNYGKHKWLCLGNGEMDEYDGYYIVSADVPGGYEGTGIFYTEFDDDYDEDD